MGKLSPLIDMLWSDYLSLLLMLWNDYLPFFLFSYLFLILIGDVPNKETK